MDNKDQDIFYTLVDRAKEVSLTERERSKLFMSVDGFVERNPVPIKKAIQVEKEKAKQEAGESFFKKKIQAPKLGESRPVKSPFTYGKDLFALVYAHQAKGVQFAAVMLVVVLFGAGTSFAAQGSLPGDILYPIKVNVNEEIKSVFLSGVSRSKYEVVRVENRIAEVKELAERGELPEKVRTKVATKLNSHLSQVREDLAVLTNQGDLQDAFEISNDLEATLQDGEVALVETAHTDTNTDNSEEIAFAQDLVRDSIESSEAARVDVEEKIYTRQTDDEVALSVAQSKLDSVQKVLATIQDYTAKYPEIVADEATDAGLGNATSDTGTPSATSAASVASSASPAASSGLAHGGLPVDVEPDGRFIQTKAAASEPVEIDILERIHGLIGQGQEKLLTKEYTEAFRLFREAYDLAQSRQTEIETKIQIESQSQDGEHIDMDSTGEPMPDGQVLGDEIYKKDRPKNEVASVEKPAEMLVHEKPQTPVQQKGEPQKNDTTHVVH